MRPPSADPAPAPRWAPWPPSALRDASALAGDLSGRRLFARDADLGFQDCLEGTILDGRRADLAGRSVLIATSGQLASALALIELDGIARRLLLCPPDLKAEHLAPLVAGAGIEAVVTDREPADLPGSDGLAIHRVTRLPRPGPVEAGVRHPTEWVLLTSGTTGVPKMVAHSLAGLTGAIGPAAAAGRPPVWATFYDIRRYGGLQIFLRGVLGTGSLVLSSAGEPVAEFLERLGGAGVTHLSGTPSHWRRALMSPAIRAIDPAYVRLSGEIADQAVLDALKGAFPRAAIGHAYASTEAGVGFEVSDGLEGFPASLVGRTGTDVEIKVVDGSLMIRSARAAAGYVGPGDRALAGPDGFIDTGDMVEERDGRFRFVGRRGGIINVGGLKVHPEEVETVINRHPGVRMSLVEGRRNPITGAVVVATVVLDGPDGAPAGAAEAARREIIAACRQALPPHKVPAILRFAPSLALTAAGKVSRAGGSAHA